MSEGRILTVDKVRKQVPAVVLGCCMIQDGDCMNLGEPLSSSSRKMEYVGTNREIRTGRRLNGSRTDS